MYASNKKLTSCSKRIGVTSWMLPCRGEQALRLISAQKISNLHVDFDDFGSCSDMEIARFCDLACNLSIDISGFSINTIEKIGLESTSTCKHEIDKAFRIATMADASMVYVPSFGRATIRSDLQLRQTTQLLRYALDVRPGSSVEIATENNLDAKGLSVLLERIGDPAIRILFDTQNVVRSGCDPIHYVRQFKEFFCASVHLKDGVHHLGDSELGLGACRITDILRELESENYKGVYVLENDYRFGQLSVCTDRTFLLDRLS